MGIKLDWDIESEAGKHREHKEDFRERKERYLAFLRRVIVVLLFLLIIGLTLYLIRQRLEQVDSRVVQLLVETVEAEVAALRIGDFDTFINVQRSATDEWLLTQQASFEAYQALKVASNVTLSGRVVNTEIDGLRGRVQVEELIDGVPYVQTWFYWKYDDGWRHVPADYTFWGSAQVTRTERFEIRYRSVDQAMAEGVQVALDRWLDQLCLGLVDCSTLPMITVDIIPDPALRTQWANPDQTAWQMVIPSPYTGRARLDLPFTQVLQIESATLIAEKIVRLSSGDAPIVPFTDAMYLRDAITKWLVGRFVQVNTESYLVESLVVNYGSEALRALLMNLRADSSIQVIGQVLGVAVQDASLDWRDFVAWRLFAENELIRQGDEARWRVLYDLRDPALVTTAYSRYNAGVAQQDVIVLSVARVAGVDGTPQLQAQVQVNSGTEVTTRTVLFALVEENWLRAN